MEEELESEKQPLSEEIVEEQEFGDYPLTLLDNFLGKERANQVLKSINTFLSVQAKAKIEKLKIDKIQVENQVKITEIHKEQQLNEQRFISNFDIRSKAFSLTAMVIVLTALYMFNQQGSVDKEFTKTIFTVITSIISIGGLNLVNEIINRNKRSD